MFFFIGNIQIFDCFNRLCLDVQLNGKNANWIDMDKKKKALSDIQNAQSSELKSSMKEHIDIVEEEQMVHEFASSKYVDFDAAWVDKNTLTNDEINLWIKMLNIARNMNPNDETEPSLTPEEEIIIPTSKLFSCKLYISVGKNPKNSLVFKVSDEDEYEPFPISLVHLSSPRSPRSSDYNSSKQHETEEEPHSSTLSFYNDSEMSALNRSVFELTFDDDEHF